MGNARAARAPLEEVAYWQGKGRYGDEVVQSLAALLCGKRAIDRLGRDQLGELGFMLECAVRGRVPERYREPGVWAEELRRELNSLCVQPVLVPHDCRDGFYSAYRRRPEAYLEPRVRAGISVFARLPQANLRQGLDRLQDDLAAGNWQTRHAELMALDELDLGHRVIVAELT